MFRRGKSRKFAKLAEALPRVLRRLNLGQVIDEQKAIDRWPEAAGREVSRHTRALAFEKGTLLVSVDSPGWMNQLTYLKPQLLKALARQVKQDMVKDIRFVLRRGGGQY